MPTTDDNLREAFAGECQAFRKYHMFASKAEEQGLPNIARLFRTTAAAERIHAEGLMTALQGVKSTAENLQTAIDGETYEYKSMYPPMVAQAAAENHRAIRMLSYAAASEAVHADLYTRALESAKTGQDLSEAKFYLCPTCGHIELGTRPTACPICGMEADKFIQV